MTIITVRSSEFFSMVEDKLLQYEVDDQKAYVKYLQFAYEQNPGLFFITAAIEENEIIAFLVAFATPEKNHTFVLHAWAKPGIPEQVTKIGFLRLSEWTRSLGRDEVRAETRREAEAFYRRWGFEQISVVMGYKVNQQEVNNGGRQQSKSVDDVKSSSTGSESESIKVDPESVQAGRESDQAEVLQGGDSSSTGPGVSASEGSDLGVRSESTVSTD